MVGGVLRTHFLKTMQQGADTLIPLFKLYTNSVICLSYTVTQFACQFNIAHHNFIKLDRNDLDVAQNLCIGDYQFF